MNRKNLMLTGLVSFFGMSLSAQDCGLPTKVEDVEEYNTYLNWYNHDVKANKAQGASVEKAYKDLLAGKKPSKIIVAVIDGGIDPEHEDLKSKMWVNKDEIPDNGKDDDGNGYVDDIYGWNFLGGSDGRNINEERLEMTRIYARLKPKYDNKTVDQLKEGQKEEYDLFVEVRDEVEKNKKTYSDLLEQFQNFQNTFNESYRVIRKELKKDDPTIEEIQNLESIDQSVMRAKTVIITFNGAGLDKCTLDSRVELFEAMVNNYYNIDFDPRAEIIGDDPSDIDSKKGYGNNDVKGPDAFHGSFCAGIIGAERGNNIGIDGIADVQIMAIRAVPNGDEYDKDVALAIRYAVDNGAKVVNMSFGKMYSPYKSLVDDAIAYADSKGVLLINAAGNDATDVDEHPHYPIDRYDNGGEGKNMITVGASSKKKGKTTPGYFSNYGQKHVDIFAPGVNIVSTAPDNTYEKANGTSFAAPCVSGVTALVWSYYPNLSYTQIKQIIMESSRDLGKKKVILPWEGEGDAPKVRFRELSVTGGLLNAYNAIKMAEAMSSKS